MATTTKTKETRSIASFATAKACADAVREYAAYRKITPEEATRQLIMKGWQKHCSEYNRHQKDKLESKARKRKSA